MTPEAVIRRAAELRDARRNHENVWQRIADYIMPSREFVTTTTPGARRLPLIYNTEPILAAEQLAGALHGMMTSPSLRWCALRASDRALDQVPAVRAWFEAATDQMYDVFASAWAAFDMSLYEGYLEDVAFGSDVTYVADHGRRGPRFQAIPIAECMFAENAEGRVDTLFRCYSMSAANVLRTWPDTCSEKVREVAAKKPDTLVKIVHATCPAEPGAGGKPFHGCYVEEESKTRLELGGYEEFPYVVARWSKRAGETYGTGPALNALPEVRKLNRLEELQLRGVAKTVDPPQAFPDDYFIGPLDLNPNGLNFYRADTPGPDRGGAIAHGARPDQGRLEIERSITTVKRMFYIDWMNLPVQPNMTATEVLQRRDEMLRLLGPMESRLRTEKLDPLIARTFNIMWRNGMFPPPPAELAGAAWHVEYLGPLAMAQRAADAEAATRWLQSIALMAQLDPSVVDVVDSEEMGRFLADRQGAPARVVRAREVVAQLRADRAERQQAAEQLAAANSMAQTAQAGAAAVSDLGGMTQQQQGVAA